MDSAQNFHLRFRQKEKKKKTKKDKLRKIIFKPSPNLKYTDILVNIFFLEVAKNRHENRNQTESKPKVPEQLKQKSVGTRMEKRALKIIPSEGVTAAHQAKPWQKFTKQ